MRGLSLSSSSRDPDNTAAFGGIVDRVLHEREACVVQQARIFGGVETCMVERIAPVGTDRLTVSRAGVEHQDGAARRMGREDGKHGALIIGLQVKKAVPREHACKMPAE